VGNFSDEILEQLGLGVRLNPHEYRACMGESVTGSMVEEDLTQAASLGIETLPAVFVNGLRVDDPVDYAPLRLHIAAAAAGG
jgi:protein-disulfide isomerase